MDYWSTAKRIPLFAFFLLSLACGSTAHTAEIRREGLSEKQFDAGSAKKPAGQDPRAICDRIVDIKELPFDPEERGIDLVYDTMMDAGETVVPCLITKVTDVTSMPDPRSAPRYPDIDNRVGDVAYFVFLDITKLDLVEFLPPDVKKRFVDVGVYAYFKYVERKENRVKLQGRLSEWYRTKYGRDP